MADSQQLLRQWLLLRTLVARRYGASIRELADEFQVVQKTIRRDLQMLARVGFPLHETVGPHGRKTWTLDGPGGLPQLHFDVTEALSLYLGRRFLEPLAGTYLWEGAQSAFKKIRAALGEPALRHLQKMDAAFHHTQVGAGDYTGKAEIVDALVVGIEDRRFTNITYQSLRSTEPVTGDIYPYGLIYHRGSLYVVAFAPEHQEVRHYKVDRILEAVVQDLRFIKPADFDLAAHLADSFGVFAGKGTATRIRVEFLPAVARYVAESRWHASQKLTPQRDGSVLLEVTLGDTDEIEKWILSFGANAIVLEPPGLRDRIIATLEKLLDAYRQPGKIRTRPRA